MEEAKQINVEVSRATAEEEEAQGKGLVDGIMEVQKVTESSGPLQPKSFNGLASAITFRQRHGFKEKKTAEWALLVTSVVLEATSAIFDQLGYALTSMVMAFVALFLSILDLILKARERGITCDGRSLLPCFYRHSSHDVRNRKPFASLVQYFGLAGALWQCCFTTVGYHYTHHNPIKLCLLPFILALCVLISKVVKSSHHEM
ncbi:hypothetical protein OIU77_002443 [Salix suchowensis]|uniref:Uncharacterized protein n=1 Tax=Salix suchowensis TaxID=1278906 RepID=A0ABQ8ZGF1_9ROSI|nr:hypothetical protein OIU77_002443 [Salix suchowensis]